MSEPTTLNPAIHAAFRRDLLRFDASFASLGADAARRSAPLMAAWHNFSYQLHRHHQDEESFFWPAFRELGVDSAIIDALEGEHGAMVAALEAADGAMEEFCRAPTASTAQTARGAVAELNRILVAHLAHEQRDLDPFSVEHKRTRQHKSAEHAARKAHREGAGNFFAWLCDGADAETARIIRNDVPAPVLRVLTLVGGGRYRRIAAAWAAS